MAVIDLKELEKPRDYNLPNLGNGIDYHPKKTRMMRLKRHYDQFKNAEQTLNRIRSGEVGPELQAYLSKHGPGFIKNPINDGRLSLRLNVKNPYIGFTYNFR